MTLRGTRSIDAAHLCPQCKTNGLPAEFCDEHRCLATTVGGRRCTKSATHRDVRLCGVHVRKPAGLRPSWYTEDLTAGDDVLSRTIRRLAVVPVRLGAMETFQVHLSISADEFLAEVMRGEGGGDKGAQLRQAGFTALAEALGL